MTDNLQSQDNELLKLMRAREEREAREADRQERERVELAKAKDFRRERRVSIESFEREMAFKRKAACDHRKGTSGHPKWKHVDYDISVHTFANGVTVIKCLKCKHKSFPGDTKELTAGTMENLMAKGKKVPNPTKLSYSDFYKMSQDDTTNTPTRAEMITQGPQPVVA
jgi:hypothetical protein